MTKLKSIPVSSFESQVQTAIVDSLDRARDTLVVNSLCSNDELIKDIPLVDPTAKKPRETQRSYIKRMKKAKLLSKDLIAALEAELPLTEAQVQKPMWDWCEKMGYFPIKFENQATFDPAGFRRNFAGGTKRKGVSDLIFFIGGRVVFCEVKVPERYEWLIRNWEKIKAHTPKPKVKGKKQSKDDKTRYKEQMGFIEEVKARGQIGFFADGLPRLAKELLNVSHQLSLSESEKRELQSLAAL